MDARPRARPRSPRRRLVLAQAVIASTLVAARSWAEPPQASAQAAATASPTTAGSDATKEEARAHFERGRQLLKDEQWDAALAEFLTSRKLFPTRGNTQNAAVALRKVGRFDEALDMFEALLREFPALPAQDKQGAMEEIEALRSLVGALEVRAGEPGATVLVDGRERGTTPLSAPLRVAAGSHLVRVYKDGFVPFETRVDVAGNQTVPVSPRLAALSQSGRLKVTESAGKRVDVVVDNVVVGKTPWEGLLPPGDHTVLLRGEGTVGTQPASAPVRLNQVTPLTLAAEPLDAELRLAPTPVSATVALDGVTLGRGLWSGRVRPGAHTVEVAAEGFLLARRTVTVGANEQKTAAVALDRDPTSSLWAAAHPPKIFVEATGGLAHVPALGGDLGEGCASPCTAGLPFGLLAQFHGGYELGSGIGVGLDAGYLRVAQTLEGRATTATPVGRAPAPGTANDSLTLSGLVVGLAGSYHRGEAWPFLLRLGAGALLGAMTDRREGAFTPAAPLAPFTIPPTDRRADARYAYVAPEARIGYRLGKHLEISAGVQALFLVALTQPKWVDADGDPVVVRTPTANEFGGYGDQALAGGLIVVLTPSLGLRADF